MAPSLLRESESLRMLRKHLIFKYLETQVLFPDNNVIGSGEEVFPSRGQMSMKERNPGTKHMAEESQLRLQYDFYYSTHGFREKNNSPVFPKHSPNI